MPTEKEVKKLSKDLVLAIDWAAAEYDYLKELLGDLAEIKESDKPLKKLRKASKILRYVSKAERRTDKFEERARKKLSEISEELEEHLGEQFDLKDLITSIRDIAKELEVEHAHLVSYASFYDSSLEKNLDKATVEAKLMKAGYIAFSSKSKSEKTKIHAVFLQLVYQIEYQVEDAEKWIKALEASLKKAQQVLEKLPDEYKENLMGKGMWILERYKFPVDEYPQEARFMAQYPADLKEMVAAAGKKVISLFKNSLPAVKDLINEETWPGIVKIAVTAGEETWLLSYLPDFKDLIDENTWPMFVDGIPKMAAASRTSAKYLFEEGLPAVKDLINENTWPGMVKMVQAAGESAGSLFHQGLPAVKDLINEKTWSGMIKMVQIAGENATNLFYHVLPIFKDLINEETWPSIVKNLPKITKYCKGTEYLTYLSLRELKPLFQHFSMDLFDLLIFPTLKRQSVASYLCFRSFGEIAKAIQTKEDIDILIKIMNKRKFKANDFFENILIEGIKEHVIVTPLSKEKEYLLPFLDNSPVDLIEVYREYKNLMASDHPEKHKHIEKLFKDLKKIKKDVFAGLVTKDYQPELLLGILYSVFSPELTVPRESYQQVFDKRTDRQADIPKALHRLLLEEVKISLGGYALKEGETLNDEAWQNLVEVVAEVNQQGAKTIVPEMLGLQLLESFLTKELKQQQKKYLKLLYTFAKQQGEGLPEFNIEHSTLMKYKEFVGDRLRNDLITALLDAAYTKQREKFAQLISKVKKPKKMDGLAKTIFGLWKSNKTDKEVRIRAILERNNIFVHQLNWKISKWQDIRDWLQQHAAGTISKQMINDIFAMLMGEDYNKMQHEMDKFEHSHQATGRGGRKFFFMLSKRKLHSVAMFNMGVCVAPDDKLWDMPDFWQMIVWDELKEHAFGGVIYRTIEEQGKHYLILSIQPNGAILSEISPVHLYDNIIKFSEKMRKKLGYDQVLIPTEGSIHSNRGSIQAIIKERNYPTKKLLKKYEFSYSPYHYKYREFFIVG